jgi:hypothetical protein
MSDAAGPTFIQATSNSVIRQYPIGDMTSTVYPVGGGLEDWAYGAGFDKTEGATLSQCKPRTYSISDDFFSSETDEFIRTAIYLIETDNHKNPDENSYGSRDITAERDGSVMIAPDSIYSKVDLKTNGHINRNIRAAMTMIDMAKPYVVVISVTEGTSSSSSSTSTRSGSAKVTFKINGCRTLDSVTIRIDGELG